MDIAKSNKEIAEFMDVYCKKVFPIGYGIFYKSGQPTMKFNGFWTKDAAWKAFCMGKSYHTSWEWLMPVVEKIKDLGFKYQICSNANDGDRYYCEFGEEKILSFGITSIEAVYKAVVEFIKWYNKNKKEVQYG
jgi:hypothetical protein